MTTTELRDLIKAQLPKWKVTINEQEMMNVQADDYERFAGFVYVEELSSAVITYGFGRNAKHTHDVYICVLGEYDTTAEQREDIRMQRIYPVVRALEDKLHAEYGISKFKHDKYPRGFDAHEILVHIEFDAEGKEC